ncbi:MAG: hypothetical protein GF398_12020 [Chitinivibrionales bacterium]|nr:hypothetical protein [Chitinivibrionales bacterium]
MQRSDNEQFEKTLSELLDSGADKPSSPQGPTNNPGDRARAPHPRPSQPETQEAIPPRLALLIRIVAGISVGILLALFALKAAGRF